MQDENIRNDLLGQMMEATIANAINGDTESARKILREFCGAIKANTDKNGKPFRKPSGTGTQIDERILRYLGECFEKILDDAAGARVDANHALGIVEAGKRGNKKTKVSRERALDIGYQVMDRHVEIKTERKRSSLRGDDSPLDEAINDVAKKHKKSYQTVKDAYDEWKKLLNQGEDYLQNMGN